MTLNKRESLIRLHYYHTLSNHQTLKLLQLDPFLTSLKYSKANPSLLSLLNLSPKKSLNLQQNYLNFSYSFIEERLIRQQIHVMTIFDEEYPSVLKEIHDPPLVLYIKGDKSKLQAADFLGIIGARKATAYTAQCLKLIIPPLLERNICIVSGMALGADGIAHTLSLKGCTIGVLGSGFDHLYPSAHKNLYHLMESSQLLISEYPPYLKPSKHFFPMRNRIIAGLTRGILVTQAAIKSGSMITVDRALEEGRDVFSIPGPITDELSAGTNHLIKQGAVSVTSAKDILVEWGIS
ncbi:DNA-processing protein DprA [Jeotgalibacillus proteolyticus]|uniref:DNA-protecting protein DprA n=1 Tax=Jeotgalibacillus proteolyticus TaxID=2082395 RepID=A0A2S5GGH5_9BACL|nr:DNA-processing protein DprA [Jeotgalibacillus proteolyticus]PPA72068.1 DNA-protecting protein DprA [Jeotgalibacillus proteolyticus]